MSVNVYDKIKELGIEIPQAPAKGGVYKPLKEFGQGLAYISGCGPIMEGKEHLTGKVGRELTLEEGRETARKCILNVLAVIQENIGDLNKVKNIVKILSFVASDNEFYDQPQIINAASELLIEIFGEDVGCASRSAIGVNVLPGNIPVEIEAIIELNK